MGLAQYLDNKAQERFNKRIQAYFNNAAADIKLPSLSKKEFRLAENKIWYKAQDSGELYKFYKQRFDMDTGYYNQNHFYKSIDNNPDLVLQHFNLSQQIVYAISNLTFGKEPTISVIDGNKQTAKKLQSQLDDIYSDNKKMPFLLDAARKLSYSGAVGIMLNLNEFVSKYPIMQAYPKENIDVLRTYGRISDIIFKDYYDVGNNKTLTLYSIYGRGYIKYKLVREGYNQATGTSIIEELPLDTLPQTADLEDCYFKYSDGTPYDKIFAVYVENKDGRSSYEGCIDDFISIDENYSQFETFIRNSGL